MDVLSFWSWDAQLGHLLIGFIGGLLVCLMIMPSILEVAYKKQLFDIPDERKVHTLLIPSLGGIGIFAAFLLVFTLIGSPSNLPEYKFILAAYLLLFFTGLKDDLILMSAGKKLIIQILAASLLIIGGLQINSLFGILGIEEIPVWLGIGITLFIVVLITNAFNLIDGIDGLAGGLGGINCLSLGALLYAYSDFQFALLAFTIAGALLGFLRYNFRAYPKKMFMGDTGSLLLGFSVAILSLRFLKMGNMQTEGFTFLSPPVVLLGIMFIPIMDVFRVSILRILNGQSPFQPDRNHIHHELLRSGMGHRAASISLYIVNILFVISVFVFRNSDYIQLSVILLLIATVGAQLLMLRRYILRKRELSNLYSQFNDLKQENRFI